METEFLEIPVAKLKLDIENPRFADLKTLHGLDLSEDVISEKIEKDKETKSLLNSIKKSGVQDPLWVQETDDGNYVVVEGNRRTTVLRMLIRADEKCEEEYDFNFVKAHVIPSSASKQDVIIKKATLQTGKKEWGKYNEANLIYQLEKEYYMMEEDIAARLGKSKTAIENIIKDYEDFMRYSKSTGDKNPKKFSFFQEAPKNVKEWYSESKESREKYYSLITPIDGNQKIRAVATKNGLRDFGRNILTDEVALNAILTDPTVDMEEAMALAKDNDVKKELKWVGQLDVFAQRIRGLDEIQIAKVRQDPTLRRAVKALARASQQLDVDLDN